MGTASATVSPVRSGASNSARTRGASGGGPGPYSTGNNPAREKLSSQLPYLRTNTRRAYSQTCQTFLDWLGEGPLDEAHVLSYLQLLRDRGLAGTSLIRHRAALRWLYVDVLRLPAPYFPKISVDEHEPRYLTADELVRVRAACETPIERAVVAVMVNTGVRAFELLAMEWGHISEEGPPGDLQGYLTVFGKGGREETVPLWAETIAAVRDVPRKRGRARVFGFGYDALRRLCVTLAARAEIEPFTPHSLRHTAATQQLLAGTDLRDVQALLRHKNIATTTRYTHLRPVELARRLARV